MNNKSIQLTEQDLHMLIEDAVKIYLTEELEEGWWGGLKNVGYGMKRGNWNFKTNYRVGNQASSFNKYASSANDSTAQMIEIAKESGNPTIATSLGRIAKQMMTVAQGFTKEAQRIAGPQDAKMTVKNPWAAPKTPRAPKATATTPAQIIFINPLITFI